MNTTRARTDLDWPEWLPALPDPDAPDARITALIIIGGLVLSGGNADKAFFMRALAAG